MHARRSLVSWCCSLLCVAAVLPVPISADVAEAPLPSALVAASRTQAVSMHGVIINERHMHVVIAAGPLRYSERNDAFVMQENGAFMRLQYVEIIKDGHRLSAAQIAQRQDQDNALLERGEGFFKQPFDPLYLHDYTFDVVPCTCKPGERAIAFRSDVRDDQHGDGLMHISVATGHVLDLNYTPNVLPKYANAATATESFGEPLPGLWCIVRIDRTYSGHVAFFRGGGKITEILDHFSRPVSASAGYALLSAQ